MKKQLIFMLLVALIVSSCKGDKMEVLNETYLTKTDSSVKVISSGEEINESFNSIPIENPDTEQKIEAQVFINEKGSIEKINVTETDVSNSSQEIAAALSKVKIKPAVVNGENVKSQTEALIIGRTESNSKTNWSLELKPNDRNADMINSDAGIPDSLKGQRFSVIADQMPAPIGGLEAIQRRIKYPEIAKRAGIEGRVFVKALVDEKGDVVYTEIIKGIGQDVGIDEAAMEAIKETKFKPAIQEGKPIKVQVSVPILFKLQEKENVQ